MSEKDKATKVATMTQTSEADAKAAADAAARENEADAKADAKAPGVEAVRERNKDVDPFDPASRIRMHLPTSEKRVFLHVAEVFGIESRMGSGPCRVLKRFSLPCGDLAIIGDTFDPVVERMHPVRYRTLLARKFFTAAPPEVETKLLTGANLTTK